MSDHDAFNQEPTTPETPEPKADPFADKLKEITAEDGRQKYSTVEDALGALKASQDFIATLKAEKTEKEQKLQEAQAELEKRKSVEEVVESLTSTQHQDPPKADPPKVENGLSAEQIEEIVAKTLGEKEKTLTAKQNRSMVTDTLSKTFGDDLTKVVSDKAKELGISTAELGKMSEDKPQLVLSLFQSAKAVDKTITPSTRVTPDLAPKPGLEKPETSIMRGDTAGNLVKEWKKVKEHTYKELGVTE